MTMGGMGFIPERLLIMMMMMTVGRPDSISTEDLMEKTHQLPISVMIKETF